MKQTDKITIFHLTLLAMMAIGLKNHVIVIPPLIQTAGRDAWISVIIVFFLTLGWCVLLIYIHRGTNREHLYFWLKQSYGKWMARLLVFFLSFYIMIIVATTLRETISWTKVTFLIETPAIVLTILFIVPCFLAALTSLRAIATANFFLLLMVNVLGFFVATANLQFKDHSLLLPILENGFMPVLKALIYQGSGMVEMILFILFQHKLHSELRYHHLLINSMILTGLTLGPLTGAIIEFGPTEASLQRFPAYEEWGLVKIGNLVQHVDYLSIYQWLSGAFIRISLGLFLLREAMYKTDEQKGKKDRWIVLVASLLISIFVMLPINDIQFFHLLIHILLPATFWIFFSFTLLLGFLVFINRRKVKKEVGS